MKKPEIIFIDLDGTALDAPAEKWFQKLPSEYTISVIKKLSKEIKIVPSTGRGMNATTLNLMNLLGTKDFIAWNGAQIVRNLEVVQKATIPSEIAQELFNEIAKNNCFVVFNSNVKQQAFVKKKFYKMIMQFGKATARTYNQYQNDIDVNKALVWTVSKKKIAKLAQEWKNKFAGKLEVSISGSSNNILEITAFDVSKGSAEETYCKMVGINPKNAIHIGDSLNDASCQGKIGKLVAMKNSVPELIAVADDVTEFTCNESGLGKYLEQFLD
ncbi:Cof-type HAD-IIB family hydrolase [Mycoplasma buteonis]|uniref:Cof-type HAD-IIB family hydrolase n=1 Tax=Mycoplasma buteonis TaxID=171280 RepID=UPI00055B15CE|nr:Cof-type HAD-IIB family hydrolase [Mycoplasma buteonis]